MVGLANQDASEKVTSYYNGFCKNSASDCGESDYTKGDVKKASIHLTNGKSGDDAKKYDMTLENDDILYFNSKQFVPIVGQHVTAQDLTTYGCDATTQIVVGRPFLAKYEAVMKVYNKDVKRTLAFIPNEGTSSIFLII